MLRIDKDNIHNHLTALCKYCSIIAKEFKDFFLINETIRVETFEWYNTCLKKLQIELKKKDKNCVISLMQGFAI